MTTTRRLPFSRLIWFGPVPIDELRDGAERDERVSGPVPATRSRRRRFADVRGQRDGQALERLEVDAQRLGQAHDDVEAPVALEDLPADRSAERRAHDLLHVGQREAVARERVAVDRDLEHRQAGHLLDLHVGRARDPLEHRGDRLARREQQRRGRRRRP